MQIGPQCRSAPAAAMGALAPAVLVAALFLVAQARVFRASHPWRGDAEILCAGSSAPAACAAAGELAPHPDDCRLFYQCARAGAAPLCRRCPAGLHFNPVLHVCDHPERAGCMGAPPSTSTAAPAVPDDIPARCAASVAPVSCAAAGADALLPHPADCTLFYYCVGAAAAPVCRECPAGLHFSPALHVCAAPDVAGCAASTSTTTEPAA